MGSSISSSWLVRACQVLVLLWMCGISCCAEVKEVTKAMLDGAMGGEKEGFEHFECELRKAGDEHVAVLMEGYTEHLKHLFEEARLNEKLHPLEEGGPEVVVDSLSYHEEDPRRSVLVVAFRRLLEDDKETRVLKYLYKSVNTRSLVATSFAKCTDCGKVSSVTRWDPKLEKLTATEDIEQVKTILRLLDNACKGLVTSVVHELLHQLGGMQAGRFFTKDGACMFAFELVPAKEAVDANPPFVQKIKPKFYPTLNGELKSQAQELKKGE